MLYQRRQDRGATNSGSRGVVAISLSLLLFLAAFFLVPATPAEAGLLGKIGKVIAAPVTLPMKLFRRGNKKKKEGQENTVSSESVDETFEEDEHTVDHDGLKVRRSSAILASSVSAPTSVVVDRVVAKVGKEIITLSEVEEMAFDKIRKIWQEYQGAERQAKVAAIHKAYLKRLIENKLQLGEAIRMGLKASEKDVGRAVEDIKKENKLDDEKLKAMLKQTGMTFEDYQQEIHDQILIRKAFNFAVRSRIIIDADAVQSYYDEHVDDYAVEDEVQASHILLRLDEHASRATEEAVSERMQAIRRTLLKGADFAKVAQDVSEGPAAERGGDLGVFRRGQVLPAIEQHAFGQAEGEVGEIFRTRLGYHLIKTEKLLVDKRTPFEFVHRKIRTKIYREKTEARYKEWIAKLRTQVFVDVTM